MSQKVEKTIFILFCISLLVGLSGNAFAGSISASDFIDNLSINGDLRIRYEYSEKDLPDEDPTDRWRQRFRLGMKWKNDAEKWTIAAGLATGGADATSTNHTYSDTTFFETGDIRLDYAYAEHKIDAFKFIAGQQKNPFLTSWALWDSDVRPVGFTGQYNMGPAFVTLGGYDVRYIDRDVAYMYAVQAGAKLDFLTAAITFYNFHRVDELLKESINNTTDENKNEDENKAIWERKLANLNQDYGYDIIDLYLSSDIKTAIAKITPYAHIFYNFGADGEKGQSFLASNIDPENNNFKKKGGDLDPEKENMGWLVGIKADIDKFSIAVDYAKIGADSCLAALRDPTFGSALNLVDVQGFKVGMGYQITRNFNFVATAYLYEAAERDIDQDPKTYEFDLNYKF